MTLKRFTMFTIACAIAGASQLQAAEFSASKNKYQPIAAQPAVAKTATTGMKTTVGKTAQGETKTAFWGCRPVSYCTPLPCYRTYYSSPSYYGSPVYSAPSYGVPSYGMPSYGVPAYGAPAYGAPSYGAPIYSAPSYGAPMFNSQPYVAPQQYLTAPSTPTIVDPFGAAYPVSSPAGYSPVTPAFYGSGAQPVYTTPAIGSPYFP